MNPLSTPLVQLIIGGLFLLSLPAFGVVLWHVCRRGKTLFDEPSKVPDLPASWKEPVLLCLVIVAALLVDIRLMPVAGIATAAFLLHSHGIHPLAFWQWCPRELYKSFGLAVLFYLAFMPLMALLMAVSVNVLRIFHIPIESQTAIRLFMEAKNPSTVIFLVVFACIVAPVWEEVVFRGFIYPWLKTWKGRPFALGASAVFFGSIHANMPSFLPLTFFGFILAFLYDRTGRLTDNIMLHATFNTVTCSMMLLHKYSA